MYERVRTCVCICNSRKDEVSIYIQVCVCVCERKGIYLKESVYDIERNRYVYEEKSICNLKREKRERKIICDLERVCV